MPGDSVGVGRGIVDVSVLGDAVVSEEELLLEVVIAVMISGDVVIEDVETRVESEAVEAMLRSVDVGITVVISEDVVVV